MWKSHGKSIIGQSRSKLMMHIMHHHPIQYDMIEKQNIIMIDKEEIMRWNYAKQKVT